MGRVYKLQSRPVFPERRKQIRKRLDDNRASREASQVPIEEGGQKSQGASVTTTVWRDFGPGVSSTNTPHSGYHVYTGLPLQDPFWGDFLRGLEGQTNRRIQTQAKTPKVPLPEHQSHIELILGILCFVIFLQTIIAALLFLFS